MAVVAPSRPSGAEALALGVVVVVNLALAVLGMTRTLHTGFTLGTLGVICAGIGGAIFWRHGGQRITGAGVFGLSCLVFVGVSGVQSSMQDGFPLSEIAMVAVVSVWLAAAWTFFWRDSVPDMSKDDRGQRHVASPSVRLHRRLANQMIAAGAVLSVGLGAASQFDYVFSATVPFQATLGAMTVLMTAVILSYGAGWHPVMQLGFVLLVVVVAAVTVFGGYGRLNLVTLGLVGVVLVSQMSRPTWLKPAVLAGLGPALLSLAYMRRVYFERTYGVTTSGAESVFTPLRDCAILYDRLRDGAVGHDYGESFLVSLIFWIPRALWEGKPAGFGAVLVEALGRDDYAPDNQSYAALFMGEWFFAGGWVAVALSVLLVGLLVRLLDGWVSGLTNGPKFSQATWLLSLTLALILVTELANYVWVGSFGYTNRMVLRGSIVVFLLLASTSWSRWSRWR